MPKVAKVLLQGTQGLQARAVRPNRSPATHAHAHAHALAHAHA